MRDSLPPKPDSPPPSDDVDQNSINLDIYKKLQKFEDAIRTLRTFLGECAIRSLLHVAPGGSPMGHF